MEEFTVKEFFHSLGILYTLLLYACAALFVMYQAGMFEKLSYLVEKCRNLYYSGKKKNNGIF